MDGKVRMRMLVLGVVAVIVVAAVGAALTLSSSPEDEYSLTVAYSEKMNYEPLMVAEDKGFFTNAGLNVTPAIVTGGSRRRRPCWPPQRTWRSWATPPQCSSFPGSFPKGLERR